MGQGLVDEVHGRRDARAALPTPAAGVFLAVGAALRREILRATGVIRAGGPQALVLFHQLFDVEDSAARVGPEVRDSQARWAWLGLISTRQGSLTG